MTMPGDDAMTEPVPVRRIEVFTGAGQRRAWSAQDKARIVAESYSGLESVCSVARRYGLAQGQLFTWRREARTGLSKVEPLFAPVVIEPPPVPVAPTQPPVKRPRRRSRGSGGIELEIDGVVVRVERGADAKTVAAVICALKAGR
jgi:transposase